MQRRLLKAGYRSSTLRVYRQVLRMLRTYAQAHPDAAAQQGRPSAITGRLLQDYLHEHARQDRSASWMAGSVCVLRTVFDKLAGRQLTTRLALPKRPQRLPEILSPAAARQVVDAAPTLRDRLLLGLLYGCGLKVSELCRLTWADWNVAAGTLRVRPIRAPERVVPVPEEWHPLSHTVRCPSCQKRLGYLLLDPNYSKTFAPIEMPSDIPTTVTECPYCHVDLEKEMTEPEAGGYRR